MRSALAAAILLVLFAPPLAAEGADLYKSDRYPVEAKLLPGWVQSLTAPTPAGAWLDLLRFDESKTTAKLTLSVQSTNYRNGEEMTAKMKEQFTKDASLAILRTDARPAGAKTPAFLLFEYTRKGDKGPEHCLAAYWFHLGFRYRAYGTVREVGWKVAGPDMEKFIQGVTFTGRVFSKDPQNYTDEAANLSLWFPEDWRIKLPQGGPRVAFTSDRLGVAVWLWVTPTKVDLAAALPALVEDLKDQKASGMKEGAIANHPVLNEPTATLTYTKGAGDAALKHVETVLVHREKLYRIALVGKEAAISGGLEPYDRMVNSIAFMK